MEPVRMDVMGRKEGVRKRGEELEESLEGGQGGLVDTLNGVGVEGTERVEKEQTQALVEGLAALDGERSRRDERVGELF